MHQNIYSIAAVATNTLDSFHLEHDVIAFNHYVVFNQKLTQPKTICTALVMYTFKGKLNLEGIKQ
jgi:hypothetical protein